MFYSHEVLTSSKYGVATVWLVATLGSNSARRKVNRSEILGVDVPKACETITNSETPLALRLQSNLLYGVSSVYSQQCTFVLSDAEHVRTQVRNAMNALRKSPTTATKSYVARRDHITIVDESQLALDPDGDFIAGMPDLRLGQYTSKPMQDSLFTIESLLSQRYMSDEPETPPRELIIPSDDDFDGGIHMRTPSLAPPSSYSGSRHAGSIILGSQFLNDFDGGMLEDVGLNIDEDGNIFDGPPLERQRSHGVEGTDAHATMIDAQEVIPDPIVDDYALPGDDVYQDLLDFSPRAASRSRSSSLTPVPTDRSSSVAIVVPSRPKRKPKTIVRDTHIEINMADFTAMGRSYATDMQQVSTTRFQRGGLALAQKNARSWVFGNLGGLSCMLNTRLPTELQAFNGSTILDTFKDTSADVRSPSKRGSDEGDEDRRVRPRLDDTEVGRGDADMSNFAADDLLMDDDPSLEIGREPGIPLAEHQSSTMLQMPWNIRSSTRGSSVPRPFTGGSLGHAGSSVGGCGGFSVEARGSSIAASPLAGLPRSYNVSPDRTQAAEHEIGEELLQDDQMHGSEQSSVNEAPSWLSQSQDPDSGNFLEYILAAMEAKRIDTGSETANVAFEQVLVPSAHDRTVAAHGLMHVLSLGGRDLLKVQQSPDHPFLPIEISVG